jgi:predicted RNA binding protein YcfA (HicA-like mRNA interferase family)
MAGKLPILSGQKVRKAFEAGGWECTRQRGSHMIMVKEGHMATLSVPDHKEVARGTLRSLIRAAEMTVSEFIDLAN